MSARALNEVLALDFARCSIAVCLASLEDGAELPILQSLQMSRELALGFKRIIRDDMDRIQSDINQGDLVLKEYDAGYKPEAHELEWLRSRDVEEVAQLLQHVPEPIANIQDFTAADDFVAKLHFYIIVAEIPGGGRVLFFRKYDPKKELSRSKWLAAFFSDGTYNKITAPTFLFDSQIDCFFRGDFVFIRHKQQFQQIFRFFAQVREKAGVCLQQIRERIPIANFDAFATSCQSHLHKLTKLINIAAKPYLATVTMRDLKRTIRRFNLNVETIRDNGEEQLRFDPTNRWEILKLLDDDYLGSEMTKLQYEVNSKRAL